jgi:hypothetical protein
MAEPQTEYHSEQPKLATHGPQVAVPIKAAVHTKKRATELGRQLAQLGEGNARICLGQSLAKGTELSVLVEFPDRRGSEIRLRCQGKVTSAVNDPWDEVAVVFEEGVGLSGEQAREILAELFQKAG